MNDELSLVCKNWKWKAMATVAMEQSSDAPFLHSPLWHRSAPRRLVEKWFAGDARDQWAVWRKHLASRRQPKQPPFLTGKRPPIVWCWDKCGGKVPRDEIALSGSLLVDAAAEFAGHGIVGPESVDDLTHTLQTVAAAYSLPGFAAGLAGDTWWKLAEALHNLASEAQQLSVDSTSSGGEILQFHLLAGELPLALSYLFPELRPMRSLRERARESLSEALLELTDGAGVPHGQLLPVLPPLFAGWTRARWLGQHFHRGAWTGPAEKQYRWLLRRMIRLANGGDGCALCGTESNHDMPDFKPMLHMSLGLAGERAHAAAAATAVTKSIVPNDLRFGENDLPKHSFHSEWSGLAVLATSWSKRHPRIAASYAQNPTTIELHVGGQAILAGPWLTTTWCDGMPIDAAGTWEEQCWNSDEDCDYLELCLELDGGLRIERQILLAKQDGLLFLADNVASDDATPRSLRHALQLPLARNVTWRPEKESRDGTLVADEQRLAVLPLSLHEWRSDPRGGSLADGDGNLTLAEEVNGRAVCCPLLIDLKARRSTKERTWRQLSVAESLQIVPRERAVGFRAQVGRDQWLIYRSLGPAGNRTVLGQNFSCEFAAGRFLATGEFDEWIEIEAQ